MTLAPIVHELRLTCPLPVAFETYVSRISEWWPRHATSDPETFTGVTVEPGVGGRVVATHGTEEQEWGLVTDWAPGVRLAHTFTVDQPVWRSSLVRVDMWSIGSGTGVRVEHGGWAPGSERVRDRFTAWPRILGGFARLAEHPGPEK